MSRSFPSSNAQRAASSNVYRLASNAPFSPRGGSRASADNAKRSAAQLKRASQRLMSLDALRGLNMLFIIGLSAVIVEICNLCPGAFSDALKTQMSHVEWNGIRHHDTIFPLFLFLAGASFPFSLDKARANGLPTWRIVL